MQQNNSVEDSKRKHPKCWAYILLWDCHKMLSDQPQSLDCKDGTLCTWKSATAKGLKHQPVGNKYLALSTYPGRHLFNQWWTFDLPLGQSSIPKHKVYNNMLNKKARETNLYDLERRPRKKFRKNILARNIRSGIWGRKKQSRVGEGTRRNPRKHWSPKIKVPGTKWRCDYHCFIEKTLETTYYKKQ
jgi:hypothetical protein